MQFATYLPTAYNDGRPVSQSELRAIYLEAARLFGGATLSDPMQGAWQNEAGELYDESVCRLTVVCANEHLSEAQEFVLRAGQQLRQEAM